MNLLDMICNFPRLYRDAKNASFVKDEKLLELAQASYELCTTWFGIPSDHSQKYHLIYSSRNKCVVPQFTIGPYLIAIKKGYVEAQYAAVIAHEMYHRFTMKRPGIRRRRWVDEMIAHAVARHAVPELGYADYAECMHRRFIEGADNFNARTIKDIHINGIHSVPEGISWEDQLDGSSTALGVQLEALVEWTDICRIVDCLTWEDWLSGLTPDVRGKVVALLGELFDFISFAMKADDPLYEEAMRLAREWRESQRDEPSGEVC